MLYIFQGPSCSGKSSAADELKKFIDVQVYSGKDYLRLAKNENEAWKIFSDKMKEASESNEVQSIIYVISDTKDLQKLEGLLDKAITVKFAASPDIVKSRFAKRMNGNLPKPVEMMIERQISDWENVNARLCIDTSTEESKEIAKKIYDSIIA